MNDPPQFACGTGMKIIAHDVRGDGKLDIVVAGLSVLRDSRSARGYQANAKLNVALVGQAAETRAGLICFHLGSDNRVARTVSEMCQRQARIWKEGSVAAAACTRIENEPSALVEPVIDRIDLRRIDPLFAVARVVAQVAHRIARASVDRCFESISITFW